MDFTNITKSEAIEYCYKYENKFKSEMYAQDEDGVEQFGCLIQILESGTIEPHELPDG